MQNRNTHIPIEAMRVDIDEWDACDIKDSSYTFVKNNHSKCRHFFRSLGEMVDPSEPCMKCQASSFYNGCTAFSEGPSRAFQLDVVECDAPCQPFSHLRTGGPPEEHAGYPVIFGATNSLVALHERLQGHWVLGEQVMAIIQQSPDGDTYLDKIMQRLLSIKTPSGNTKYTGCGSFRIQALELTECGRDRCLFLCIVSSRLTD